MDDEILKAVDIRQLVKTMLPVLDARQRRLFLGTISDSLGRGAAKQLSEITGVSQSTILKGKKESKELSAAVTARLDSSRPAQDRPAEAGSSKPAETFQKFEGILQRLLAERTPAGADPYLYWTEEKLRELSEEAAAKEGFRFNYVVLADFIRTRANLQQNVQVSDTANKSKRDIADEHFQYIAYKSAQFNNESQPVVFISSETMGRYTTIPHPASLSADVSTDEGEYAVSRLSSWWFDLGIKLYPNAKQMLIACNGNESLCQVNPLWEESLQDFANKAQLAVLVVHIPQGYFKWRNEHKMITILRRGPAAKRQFTSISLISPAETNEGINVQKALAENNYPAEIHVAMLKTPRKRSGQTKRTSNWNYYYLPLSAGD